MALLLAPGVRLIDVNGNLISGGKVRVYQANTTTPASLFSDEGLSSALPNPVIANSAGWPSSNGTTPTLIFAAAGSYDVLFLDASNNVLATFEDVPTFGEEDGELSRTVSGNGRFLFTGAAGAVMLQVGDPSPDNSGGTFTVEGWVGTQLDTLTLDAAATALTGDLTIKGGKKLLGHVATAATPFTTAGTVDIELVNAPTGVRAWRIDLFDLTTTETGGDALLARLSYDGGSTYKSGASDYGYVNSLTIGASTTLGGSTGTTHIAIASGFETGTNRPAHLEMVVITPTSGNNATTVETMGFYTDPGAATAPAQSRSSGWGLGSYGRATHIRIIAPVDSTITGSYRVTPLYGFGE